MRRPLIVAGATAVALALLSGGASAAQTVTVRSPAPGTVVATPTAVVVDVQRELIDDATTAVAARLARPGTEPESWVAAPDTATLACAEGEGQGCDTGPGDAVSTWSGATIRPDGGGTFSPDAPLCNGTWRLQVRLNGEPTFRAPGSAVVLSAPPTAVRDLAASVDGARIVLSWTPGDEPDLVGQEVQRRSADGSWAKAAQLAADATTFETVASSGTHEFRVVTQRGDGEDTTGQPAPACQDLAPDLTAASPSVKATVAAPGDEPSPSPSPRGDGSGGDGSGGDGGDGGGDGGGDDGTDASGSGSSGAPPRSRTGGSGPDLVPGVAAPTFGDGGGDGSGRERERFYGEGDEFSEQLDYGGASPIAGEDGDAQYVERALEGGTVQVVAGMEIDLARILPPVAGGLVMFTMGLHLRRWMRVD